MRVLTFSTFLVASLFAHADDRVRLVEHSPPGSEFQVVAVSTIAGELLTPVAKDKPPERIKVTGRSDIAYVEKVLAVDPREADHKALRVYERIDFRKKTVDRVDETTLRPSVRRLVVMKKGADKVPFSPDGPLMFAEIEAIRTDLMASALAGLLPEHEVRPGDTWKATPAAVQELTDLKAIDSGELVLAFKSIEAIGPRRLAHVTFAGTLRGANEDGPTRQQLTGSLKVDLNAQCITFLKVEGEHFLLDEAGKEAGKVTGTFELVRALTDGQAAVADSTLRGIDLDPSEANTRLLYDNEGMGIRFVHSRNWRVVRTTGRQITLDAPGGAGILITLDPPNQLPAAAHYMREAIKELRDRGARLTNSTGPVRLADGVDRFTLDAELGREALTMDYLVVRQDLGGATLAARVPAEQRESRMKELERLARSFVVTRRPDGK